MGSEHSVTCPHCEEREFEIEHLGIPATGSKITFSSQLFNKSELKAYACKGCGFVSLFVDPA